jgi:hypothetical protein
MNLVGPDRRAGRAGSGAPGGRALPHRRVGSWEAGCFQKQERIWRLHQSPHCRRRLTESGLRLADSLPLPWLRCTASSHSWFHAYIRNPGEKGARESEKTSGGTRLRSGGGRHGSKARGGGAGIEGRNSPFHESITQSAELHDALIVNGFRKTGPRLARPSEPPNCPYPVRSQDPVPDDAGLPPEGTSLRLTSSW